MAKPYIQSKT